MEVFKWFTDRFGSLWSYQFYIPASLIAIVLHEISHGFVAYKLGDPTARAQGRLSLNPLRHIDPFGLIMLVVVGFGWAKPVHVDMRYFKNPKRGMALTAFAGPVSNLLITLVCMLLYAATSAIPGDVAGWLRTLFIVTAMRSLGLGLFNMLPIPPLDGSKVLGSFLPDRVYYTILRYEQYGMLLLMFVMFFTDVGRYLSSFVLDALIAVAGWLGVQMQFVYELLVFLYSG